MREYEILVISEIGDALHKEAREKTKTILESYGSEIFEDKDFGVYDLSYPIKKVKQGKYFFYHFKLENISSIPAIEKELRYEQSILRFVIVRLDEVKRKIERSSVKRAKIEAKQRQAESSEESKYETSEEKDSSNNLL